jgi:N-acetylneuraminate synthase
MLEPYVPAYKIGSGDIDWLEMLVHIAKKGKPVLLASGAATIADVHKQCTPFCLLTLSWCLCNAIQTIQRALKISAISTSMY